MLTSVVIEEGVTSIGNYAFIDCSKVLFVSLPNSITYIGKYAFSGCSKIQNINLSEQVETIGSFAFTNCTSLTSITIPNSVTSLGEHVFSSLKEVVWNAKNCSIPSSTTVGPFEYCKNTITSFTFGDEVEVIPAALCYNMSKLTSVVIPSSVTSIKGSSTSGAFYMCSNLKKVYNYSSLFIKKGADTNGYVGKYANEVHNYYTWSGTCGENLTWSLHQGVLTISGTGAMTDYSIASEVPWYFYGDSLQTVKISEGATTIGNLAFSTSKCVSSVIIPNGLTSIGKHAFSKCNNLPAVTLPESLRLIGGYAFSECSNLSSIIIPANVDSIGDNAFYKCTGLTSVTWLAKNCTFRGSSDHHPFGTANNITSFIIGDGITKIPDQLCYHMDKLTSITIPESVTSIGSGAFEHCTSLTSITIPNSVTRIGGYAFYGSNRLPKITIPENVRRIEYNALSQCTSLDTIIWNARDCQVEGGGVSFTGSNSPFISSDCSSPISGSHIILGEKVERVPDRLCIKFTSADFSKAVNLKTIGELAFAHSSINNLVLPINCDSIAEMAFLGCTSMKELTIPENVRYIGTNAFSNCLYLTQIHYNARRCSYATGAFRYSLGQNAEKYKGDKVTINIGASVQSIPARIFAGCTAENCSDNKPKYSNFVEHNSIGNIIFAENSECSWIGGNAFVGQILTPYNVYYTPKSCEFNNQVFISDIDTLTISNSVDTIDLRYIAHANQIINRNPRLYIKAPNYFGNLFDYTNDGKMEWMYSGKENSLSISNYYLYRTFPEGVIKDTILYDIKPSSAPWYYSGGFYATNINNDTLSGFMFLPNNNKFSQYYTATDTGGYERVPLDLAYSTSSDHSFPLDADMNGLTDFYSYENGNHYFHLHQRDGSYLKTALQILTDTAAISDAVYEIWENNDNYNSAGSNIWTSIPSLADGMFVKTPKRNSATETQTLKYKTILSRNAATNKKFQNIDTAIDIDRNGLIDLMSSSTGAVLYNLGNNRFVMGEFPGQVIAKDVNGDGVLDYVIYDTSTKTVYLQIYEGDGQVKTQTLMQNFNITNVWCYDFDNDGDIDILLPFDYTTSAGYAYLVFFRNDGNNTFKKIENAFDDPVEHFKFIDCRDVDNDGKYEIIAVDSISGTGSNNVYKGNYYLIRYNNRFKVYADPSPFISNSLKNYSTISSLFTLGDFNNDGIMDYWYYSNDGRCLGHIISEKTNSAPSKIGTPRVILDANRQMLNISWDRGSDNECSVLDLSYSLRIGSAPGKSDIWFAATLADGTQRSLWGGNVGAWLNQWVNVAGWAEGDYYIAVQAIDPNNLGGAWSDEVAYHHSLLSADFNVNNLETTTADTLLIKYAGVVNNQYTYNWNFGDSAVILSQENQTYQVAWNTAGKKYITLQVVSPDGRKSPIVSKEIKVNAVRFDAITNAPTMSYFDMDMDGKMDGIGTRIYSNGAWVQGFVKGKDDGTFIKLAKTYNSDLKVNGSTNGSIFADVNKDGLPDVVVNTSKGSIMYNNEDFDVDFSDETYTFPNARKVIYDFNNDGYADSYKVKNAYAIQLTLGGEDISTVDLRLTSEYELYNSSSSYVWISEDFDNNGYRDFIARKKSGNYFIIYLHDNFQISCQDIPVSATYPFFDLNGDGVPDFNGYQLKSRIANTSPSIPHNLRAIQTGEGVLLQWDAAQDLETPAAQMRYNISIKKKGMQVGDENAFVISPMNGLYNEASIIPGYQYYQGTEYLVQSSEFVVGQEYEFQIQSIDLWNEHSDMSAPITFKFEQQVFIDMPIVGCINSDILVKYKGTEANGFNWNFDEGVASRVPEEEAYYVSWSTAGIKTIQLSVGGLTVSRTINIQNPNDKDLSFSLPEIVLGGTWTEFMLPDVFKDPAAKIKMHTSQNVYDAECFLSLEQVDGVYGLYVSCFGAIQRLQGTLKARVRFDPTESIETGWIEFYQEDTVCGEKNNYRATTQVMGYAPAPQISIVTVDAATGKNCVIWDAPANLPSYIDKIYVYKEEGSTNNWVRQAEIALSAGQWIDMASDPAVRKNRYKITYGTNFGAESNKSTAHSSTHLQMNVGLHGANNLIWTKYEGGTIDSYRILRGTTPDNMTVIATVPGTEYTYTDLNAPEGVYYALEYDNLYFEKWVWITSSGAPAHMPAMATAATRNGHSNIMASAQSNEVTFAQTINICAMEKTIALNESQTSLHLYAEILPAMATYKRASWKIVSGADLAIIDDNGLLVANTDGKNGTLRVRATAIDGSGIYAEKDIVVSGMFKEILTESITLNSISGGTTLTRNNTQVIVEATVTPTDITNPALAWELLSGADKVSISPNENTCTVTLLETAADGEVLLSATAQDGSGVYATISLNVSLDGATAIDDIFTCTVTPRKILINDQIYILRGEKVYTITGQEVK